MLRAQRLALAITLAVLPLRSAVASEAAVDLAQVRAFVEKERESQKVPGLSVAVVVGDQLVWSQGFGLANLESGLRASGATRYRIGSVSKPIVATALMQLVEQGKVDLDAEIQDYVPQFPRKRWPVRLRHLVGHSSGIRHYKGQEFRSRRRYTDLIEPLDIFKDDPLLFEPGAKVSYSTYGFNMVANVVENVGGLPIDEYMRKHVYGPAWMNDTGVEDQAEIQPGRAGWYLTPAHGRRVNAPYVDLSNKYAGGAITSTVEDLARFHIALQRGRLLSDESLEAMYTNQRLASGKRQKYGISWVVERVRLKGFGQCRRVGHSGGSMGANTLLRRYPDQGMAFMVVANHQAQLGRILDGLEQRFVPVAAKRSRAH